MRFLLKPGQYKHDGDRFVRLVFEASQSHKFGGYFTLFSFIRKSPWSRRKFGIGVLLLPWVALELLTQLLALPLMVINIVLCELTINGSQFPTSEAIYNVGVSSVIHPSTCYASLTLDDSNGVLGYLRYSSLLGPCSTSSWKSERREASTASSKTS